MHLDWLLERMESYGEADAVILNESVCSYAQLLEKTRHWHRFLQAQGVRPGTVVALVGDYSAETCAMLLAMVDNGAIVVPLTPAAFALHPEFLEIAQVELVLHADASSFLATWRTQSVNHELLASLIDNRLPGLVLFSSGSTGKSKAALHDFTKLLVKFQQPRHKLRTLTFLLLDHIGGINTLFYALSNGGAVVAVTQRSPAAICESIAQHRVELLPVSPTFLTLLLLSGESTNYDLSSLKTITYGTEPMPQSTLDRTHEAFPNVTLQQTYGLSELGILRSKSRSSDSLWVKVGGEGFETKVVDGILWIRAASGMLGYLNAPTPFTKDGWFCTGDAVETDGEWLRILGRSQEIINVGGEKVYPAEVEGVLLTLPNIVDVSVHGERHPLTGQMVVAVVRCAVEETQEELKKRIRRACRERMAPFKIPQKVIVSDQRQFNDRFKRMRLPVDGETPQPAAT